MVKAGGERFSGLNLETVVPAELPWEQSWWSTGNAQKAGNCSQQQPDSAVVFWPRKP